MELKMNRGRENHFYVVVVIFFSISFSIFLTSKLWMFDDTPLNQTPFYKELTGLDQTKLILQKWEYNPNKQFMEVLLEMKHVGSDTVKPTFIFEAKESKTFKLYPVDVMFQNENSVVLHIRQVPNDYRVVGLFVKEIRDNKMIENELATATENVSGSLEQGESNRKITMPEPKQTILVGDYRKIIVNPKLENKSKFAYQIEQIDIERRQLVEQVRILKQEKMPLQDAIMNDIFEEIRLLEQDMLFQTDSEKQETRQQIVAKKTAIKNATEKKLEYRDEIKELQEKQNKLQKKRAIVETEEQVKLLNDRIQNIKNNLIPQQQENILNHKKEIRHLKQLVLQVQTQEEKEKLQQQIQAQQQLMKRTKAKQEQLQKYMHSSYEKRNDMQRELEQVYAAEQPSNTPKGEETSTQNANQKTGNVNE